MTYGIRIESANGSLQIDSDYDDEAFTVTSYSQSTTTATFDAEKDLVFARPVSRANTLSTVGFNGTGSTRTFRPPLSTGSTVSMEVVIGRFAGSLTTSTSGYGLQIFNASGDLAFDSEQYQGDGGFTITTYIPPFQASGTGTNPLTASVDDFVCFNSTSVGAAGGPQRYFIFDDDGANSNDGIRFVNYIPGPFGQTFYFSNFNPIWIGERGAG
jgi:hypothetical protein